jgi:hypothetical protein
MGQTRLIINGLILSMLKKTRINHLKVLLVLPLLHPKQESRILIRQIMPKNLRQIM